MTIPKAVVDLSKFNPALVLPYELRIMDFQGAMQDLYDFFFDMNTHLTEKGLPRLDDMLRPANLSGTLSDMVTESLGKHSRTLTPNLFFNGHPDLLVRGRYANDTIKAGEHGVEIKTTKKSGGAVDTHGGRDQTLCTWVYEADNDRARPATERDPLVIREIYLSKVTEADFRINERGKRGTRTSTLDKAGLAKFREGWVYKDVETKATRAARRAGPWRAATR